MSDGKAHGASATVKSWPRPVSVATPLPHARPPLSFWDTIEPIDDDLQRPSSSRNYDGIDSDDSSGARWLARATQAADADEFDDSDDPAEIAADSMSMISEASRTAAGNGPEESERDFDDDERI